MARHAGRFSKGDDVVSLVHYLDDPLPTSTIVLVWELAPGQQRLSAVPKKLGEAVTASGGVVVSTDPGSSKSARDQWWADLFARAPVRLDRRAQDLVRERLGEDVASAPALLRRLAGAHGDGAKLDADAVEPLLGEAGSVPPWELTDSIDRGDTPGAIDALHRMLGLRRPSPAAAHGDVARPLPASRPPRRCGRLERARRRRGAGHQGLDVPGP